MYANVYLNLYKVIYRLFDKMDGTGVFVQPIYSTINR